MRDFSSFQTIFLIQKQAGNIGNQVVLGRITAACSSPVEKEKEKKKKIFYQQAKTLVMTGYAACGERSWARASHSKRHEFTPKKMTRSAKAFSEQRSPQPPLSLPWVPTSSTVHNAYQQTHLSEFH